MNLKKINIMLLIVLACTIFFFSSQDSKTSIILSNRFKTEVSSIVKKFAGDKTTQLYKIKEKIDTKIFIRKCAHFFEFCLLGILAMNLAKYRFNINWKSMLLAVSFCMLFACGDEFHQLYVAGRTARLFDVLIDTSGSILGVFIYCIFYKLLKIRKKNKLA